MPEVNIPIHCSHNALEPPGKLVPNPRNPNKHPEAQIKLLTKIIAFQGWRHPIVVSKRSGFIVTGHARLEAAEILEVEVVPVDYQDYPDEATEWADMIADNRIAELAEMDRALAKDLLAELDPGNFDMDLTGYDAEALERLMTEYHPDSYADLTGQNDDLAGMEEVDIGITVPAKHRDKVVEWLANGNPKTGPGMGVGVMKRCGLL